MIHRFAVSNYRSIRDEVVLDLRIPGTAPDLPRFRPSRVKPDIRLPTIAVLMGPNGSGKTTLLRALTTMANVASLPSRSDDANAFIDAVVPFASESTIGDATRFCLDVEADWLALDETPQLFRYELALRRDRRDQNSPVFSYEALSHFPRGRSRRLFERESAEAPVRVSREISGALGFDSRAGRIGAIRDDAPVIGTLAMLKVPLATRIADWLQSLAVVSNVSIVKTLALPTKNVVDILASNSELRAWASKHLESSDLGIQGVEVRERTVTDPEDWLTVWFNHREPVAALPLMVQSGGTQRLFHLLPQLYVALEKGLPAALDEIDADLHVDIVGDMLGWFRSRETNPRNAQLLVTSHNVGLLDDMEKEELFVVEKTRRGETKVHGAQDVRGLRRDTRLYPKYRAGVLGGIPKVG